jgi:hypothetical protein
MNRNNLLASLTFCAALALNGCGGAGASGGGNAADNRRRPEAAANATPAADNAPASPSASTANAASAASVNAPAGAADGDNKAKSANMPRPQIGSGGNDFFVFTQARAALGSDAELKGATPIIEVKDGVLTLTGTVATAAQKSRAEQVARGVGGVKAVKNQLRVAAGG